MLKKIRNENCSPIFDTTNKIVSFKGVSEVTDTQRLLIDLTLLTVGPRRHSTARKCNLGARDQYR